MFTLPVRILLIICATVYAIYKIANGEQSTYVLLVATGLLVFGYFRYGAIRPAFMAMWRGDLETAQKHMRTIKFPKLLSAESMAYLHWINGAIASELTRDLASAEEEMRLAIAGALRTSNDRSIATASLARIVALSGNSKDALQLLEAAEQIPHKEKAKHYFSEVRAEIEKTEPAHS